MNRDNMLKLARYLWQVSPIHFNMSSIISRDYFRVPSRPDNSQQLLAQCDTAACALGYGPMAGIDPEFKGGWFDYCDRNLIRSHSDEWFWCFSSRWTTVDNTPRGAALRIMWVVEGNPPPLKHRSYKVWKREYEGRVKDQLEKEV